VVEGFGKVVVVAFVGGDVFGPHLLGDLEGFFEAFEAFGDGWVGDAEAEGFAFEPAGADAE